MNEPKEGIVTDQETINEIKTGGSHLYHNFFRILIMDKIYSRFGHISDYTRFWDDLENMACEYVGSIYPDL